MKFRAMILVLFMTPFTAANAGSIRCDACSDEVFKSLAISLGEGSHTIYSLNPFKAKQYLIMYEPERVRDPWLAIPGNVPSDTYEYIQDLADFYIETNGSMKSNLELSSSDLDLPDPGVSAYDVPNDYNLQAMIGDGVSAANLGSVFVSLIESAKKITGITDSWQITVTVVFPDGSTADFVINGPDDLRASYVKGTARTPGGQLIPEAQNHATGIWYGSPRDNMDRLVNYFAQRLNATLIQSDQNDCVPTQRFECEIKDNVLVCTLHYSPC